MHAITPYLITLFCILHDTSSSMKLSHCLLTFHYLQHENRSIMRNGTNESTFFFSFIAHVKQQKHRTCKAMKNKPVIEQAYAYRSFGRICARNKCILCFLSTLSHGFCAGQRLGRLSSINPIASGGFFHSHGSKIICFYPLHSFQ